MSRDRVLQSLRRAVQGQSVPDLPELTSLRKDGPLSWEDFRTALSESQGRFHGPVPRADLSTHIDRITGARHDCARAAAGILDQPVLDLPPAEINGLPWVVASGFCAIASTGSIAVSHQEVPNRLHLLLPENLILLVAADALVDDLPDFYARLEPGALAGGYLTLISGPSRTADIELQLVTGAHGPRSLTVFAYR